MEDADGWTARKIAIEKGPSEIVALLGRHRKPDRNIKRGETPCRRKNRGPIEPAMA